MSAQIMQFPSQHPRMELVRKQLEESTGMRPDEFTTHRAAALLLKKWPGGVAGRKVQRECERQACDDQASELRRCQMKAYIRERLGVTSKPIGKLRLVHESAAPTRPDAA